MSLARWMLTRRGDKATTYVLGILVSTLDAEHIQYIVLRIYCIVSTHGLSGCALLCFSSSVTISCAREVDLTLRSLSWRFSAGVSSGGEDEWWCAAAALGGSADAASSVSSMYSIQDGGSVIQKAYNSSVSTSP